MALTDDTLTGNKAGNVGGAIFNASGNANLTDVTITGNTSSGGGETPPIPGGPPPSNNGYGGGGILNNGTMTVSGSNISGNTAIYSSGGITNNATLTVSKAPSPGMFQRISVPRAAAAPSTRLPAHYR